MKKDPERPDVSRKKLVSEYLKNADKLLKSGEYDAALVEVEKSLELEPGNFYAQAYRERIAVLQERHGKPGGERHGPPASPVSPAPRGEKGGVPPPPSPAAEPAAGAPTAPDTPAPPAGGDAIQDLQEQIARDRAAKESETHRHAEELARKSLEDEIQQRAEAADLKSLEEATLAEAVAAAVAEAKVSLVDAALRAGRACVTSGDPDGAFRELTRVRILDAGHPDIGQLQEQIDSLLPRSIEDRMPKQSGVSRETAVALYSRILKMAWGEGAPSRKQQETLISARSKLGITPEEGKGLLAGVQKEIFSAAMKDIYDAGEPDPEQAGWLKKLAGELAVDDGEIERLKSSLRG